MGLDTRNRVFGFDMVRCLAILFVLLGHTLFLLPFSPAVKQVSQFFLGFTGVEIFFILSGYLVGKIFLRLLQQHPFSFQLVKYFWIRRWFRTLPAYYLVLFFYAGMFYFQHHEFFFAAKTNLLYLVFLQNFWTPHPDFFTQAWSLSVEEWFYLLLPLWIFLFYRFGRKNKILGGIITGIVLITLLRVFIVYVYDPDWNTHLKMMVPFRLDSLMTGVLTAYLHIHCEKEWNKYAASSLRCGIGVLIVASAWLLLDAVPDHRINWFASKTLLFNFFSIGVALCIPFMSAMQSPKNRPMGKIVTYISKVSYSLYLVHVLCIFYVDWLYHKLFSRDLVPVKFVASWIVFFAVASVLYWFYEKPFMELRERKKFKLQD